METNTTTQTATATTKTKQQRNATYDTYTAATVAYNALTQDDNSYLCEFSLEQLAETWDLLSTDPLAAESARESGESESGESLVCLFVWGLAGSHMDCTDSAEDCQLAITKDGHEFLIVSHDGSCEVIECDSWEARHATCEYLAGQLDIPLAVYQDMSDRMTHGHIVDALERDAVTEHADYRALCLAVAKHYHGNSDIAEALETAVSELGELVDIVAYAEKWAWDDIVVHSIDDGSYWLELN